MSIIRRSCKALAACAVLSAVSLPEIVAAQEVQYFPIASCRVGPYSAMGTGYYGA
jgi:branched-chain amino acid transport system substrate-binding protein